MLSEAGEREAKPNGSSGGRSEPTQSHLGRRHSKFRICRNLTETKGMPLDARRYQAVAGTG